jgi:ABC-2 type transport system ATP-binding protein
MSENGYAITTQSLSKRFGRRWAVDEVSAKVPRGAIYGLMGPNGAGKTTFIRLLLNLLEPTRGSAAVLGLDVVRDTVKVKQRLGHVAALQPLWDWMKVGEYARFLAGVYPKWNQEPVSAILARVGIADKDVIRDLSRGQRALVSLAVAIGHDPELLLLDEALTGLDPISRREVLRGIIEVMHAEGRTVLITGQDIADMERVCDHVGFLVRGRLVWESSLEELKERVKRLRIEHPSGPPPAVPEGAFAVLQEPRQTSFTVSNFSPDLLQALDGHGYRVEAADLGLEDIFVDLTQARLERPA